MITAIDVFVPSVKHIEVVWSSVINAPANAASTFFVVVFMGVSLDGMRRRNVQRYFVLNTASQPTSIRVVRFVVVQIMKIVFYYVMDVIRDITRCV